MVVTVQYTTQLKAALGVAQEQIQLHDDASLPELLNELANQHGATFTDLVLMEDGSLLPSMMVCIDDQQLPANQDVLLKDGNLVMFLSAISGG